MFFFSLIAGLLTSPSSRLFGDGPLFRSTSLSGPGDLSCTAAGGDGVQLAAEGVAPATVGGEAGADGGHLNQRDKVKAQYAFVYAIKDSQCKITYHHLSQMPDEVVNNNS